MQPYQEATEAELGRKEYASKLIGSALPYAKVAGGVALATKVAPFLSKYIPAGLMVKGLSKINPRLGKFAQHALDLGHDEQEIKDFMGEKVETEQQQAQPAQQDKNIVRQYSPELDEFMQKEIKSGRTAIQAGALAEMGGEKQKGFKKAIEKLVKDHKIPWSTIVQDVYGDVNVANPASIKSQEAQQQQMTQPQMAQGQPMQPQQVQPQQVGPGAQALDRILQKIDQRFS